MRSGAGGLSGSAPRRQGYRIPDTGMQNNGRQAATGNIGLGAPGIVFSAPDPSLVPERTTFPLCRMNASVSVGFFEILKSRRPAEGDNLEQTQAM